MVLLQDRGVYNSDITGSGWMGKYEQNMNMPKNGWKTLDIRIF